MSFLSEFLGDVYKPGMSEEELSKAIEKATGKLKDSVSKANSEAASYRKQAESYREQLKGFQTEQERAANERKEAFEKMEKENADLKRSISLAQRTNELLTQGYTQELAVSAATALVDGDIDSFLKAQKEFTSLVAENAKKELLGSTPYPVVGNNGSVGVDYGKLIEQANSEGRWSEAAYYTRLKAEAEAAGK